MAEERRRKVSVQVSYTCGTSRGQEPDPETHRTVAYPDRVADLGEIFWVVREHLRRKDPASA